MKLMIIEVNETSNAPIIGSIGNTATITITTIDKYRHERHDADLYACLVNRFDEVKGVLGSDKVIALALVPPAEYLIRIKKILPDYAVSSEKVMVGENAQQESNQLKSWSWNFRRLNR